MDPKRPRVENDDMQVEEQKTKILICESPYPYENVKISIVAYQKDDQFVTTLVATFYPGRLFETYLIPDMVNKIKLTNVCYHPCDVNVVNDIMQWYCSLTPDERYDCFLLAELEDEHYYNHIERPMGKYSYVFCSCLDCSCLHCRFGDYCHDIFDGVKGIYDGLVIEKILENMKETVFNPSDFSFKA